MTSPLSPDWWNPTKVVAAIFAGAVAFDSLTSVWGDRRPVGNFFEEFLARGFYWALAFASFGSGIYAGDKAYTRTDSKLAGWIVGLVTFLVIGTLASLLIMQVPGVNWRFERLLNQGNDY